MAVDLLILNRYGQTAQDDFHPVQWPGNLANFPANGSIQDVPTAIAALNVASKEFDLLKRFFVAFDRSRNRYINLQCIANLNFAPKDPLYDSDSNGSFAYNGSDENTSFRCSAINLPSVGSFNEQNWRDKLRVLASNIDQLRAIEWPYSRLQGGYSVTPGAGTDLYSSYQSSNWSITFPAFVPPSSLVPDDQLFISPDPLLVKNAGGWEQEAYSWKVSGGFTHFATGFWGVEYSAGETEDEGADNFFRGDCELNAIIYAEAATKVPSWATLPAGAPSLTGTAYFFKGPSVQSYGDLAEVVVNSSGSGLHLGSCDVVSTPNPLNIGENLSGWVSYDGDDGFLTRFTSTFDVDLTGAFALTGVLTDPPPSAAGAIMSLSLQDDGTYDTASSFSIYVEGYPKPAYRRKYDTSVYSGDSLPEAQYPAGTGLVYPNYQYSPLGGTTPYPIYQEESLNVLLDCIYLPKFTEFMPAAAKAFGTVSHTPGEIEMTATNRELIRIHLGRGETDLNQIGWLGTRADGFGSLFFNGSADAFEVLYEDDWTKFTDYPFGGKKFDASSDDLSEDQENASGWQDRFAYLAAWYSPRLRQVKGNDVVVDIIYNTPYSKEIDFYWASQASEPDGQFYTFTGAPFKVVELENPTVDEDDLPTEQFYLEARADGQTYGIEYTPPYPNIATSGESFSFNFGPTNGTPYWTRYIYVDPGTGQDPDTWTTTETIGGKTYTKEAQFNDPRNPLNTDRAELRYLTVEDAEGRDRTIAFTWSDDGSDDEGDWRQTSIMPYPNYLAIGASRIGDGQQEFPSASFIYPDDYASLESISYSGDSEWADNGRYISLNDDMLDSETFYVAGGTVHREYGWEGSVFTTTSDFNGVTFLAVDDSYSAGFGTDTVTVNGVANGTRTYSGAAGGVSPPWLPTGGTYPGGYKENISISEANGGIFVQSTAGWGDSFAAGVMSTTQSDLFGNIVYRFVQTTDGVALDYFGASAQADTTGWGAPKSVDGLRGDTSQVSYIESGAALGAVSTVDDAMGIERGVSDFDWLGRPSRIKSGFDAMSIDYSNLTSIVGTADSGYVVTQGTSNFGDLRSFSSTFGSQYALNVDGSGAGSITADGRSRSFTADLNGVLSSIENGMGTRGAAMSVSTDGGNLCTNEVVHTISGGSSTAAIHTVYDGFCRVISITKPSENGGSGTDQWTYDDANRKATYTPGFGPTFQTVESALSSDGAKTTITVGADVLKTITRSVANGALVFKTDLNDDSGGSGAVSRTVSVETFAPAAGQYSVVPWGISANTMSISKAAPQDGGATEVTNGLTGDDITISEAAEIPSSIDGVAGGLSISQGLTFHAGVFSSMSGTVGGFGTGLSADSDGRVTNFYAPGTNQEISFGGQPGFQASVHDSLQQTNHSVTVDSVGNFTGSSGDGAIDISATTIDAPHGTATTLNQNLTVNTNWYGSITNKNYTGGITETTGLNSDGSVASDSVTSSSGNVQATLTQSATQTSVSYSGDTFTTNFYKVGLPSEIIGPNDNRKLTWQNFQLAKEDYRGGLWAGWAVSWIPDEKGRPGTLRISEPSGRLHDFALSYDSFSRLNGSSSPEMIAATLGRNGAGEPLSLARGSYSSGWSYDTLGRMSGYSENSGGQSLLSYSYPSYDARNRIESRLTSLGVSWSGMQYDSADELQSADIGNSQTLGYSYDTRGNRTGESAVLTNTINTLDQIGERQLSARSLGLVGTVNPQATAIAFNSFSPNGFILAPNPTTGDFFHLWQVPQSWNEGKVGLVQSTVRGTLAGQGGHGTAAAADADMYVVMPPINETLKYGAAGRLAEDAFWIYTWDGPGRLTGMERKSGTFQAPSVTSEFVNFAYDADGRRTQKIHTVTYANNRVEVDESQVFWAGWLPFMERHLRNGIFQYRRWFQWGPDVSGTLDGAGGIGGLVAIREENDAGLLRRILLPVQDGLGNVTAVVDQANGKMIARYDYGPFGEPLRQTGDVDACPFRYQTKWFDAESAHYYFGLRYYDPRLGRWLSRDPMGEAGGFNLYAYCGNDPVNRCDALGLQSWVPDFPNNKTIEMRAGEAIGQAIKDWWAERKSIKRQEEQWSAWRESHPRLTLEIDRGLIGRIRAVGAIQRTYFEMRAKEMDGLLPEEIGENVVQMRFDKLDVIHQLTDIQSNLARRDFENTKQPVDIAALILPIAWGKLRWLTEGANLVGEANMANYGGATVYRFATRSNPATLQSNLSRASFLTRLRVNALMKIPAYQRWRAIRHMMGDTVNSPFVSVLEDANAGAATTDPWLKTIITGKPGIPGVVKAPDLGTFKVPSERLFYPEPDMTLQLQETERLYFGDDLGEFLESWQTNPF